MRELDFGAGIVSLRGTVYVCVCEKLVVEQIACYGMQNNLWINTYEGFELGRGSSRYVSAVAL